MFSTKKEVEEGCFLRDNEIILRLDDKEISVLNINDLIVPGLHNVANAMAAILLTVPLGVKIESVRLALKNFNGVSHR